MPGAGGLTLHDDGFETITLYKKFSTPWQRVSDFAVSEVTVARRRRKKFVGYNDAKYRTDNPSRRVSGYNSGLSDTYGLSHEELARLMNGWRALALARRGIDLQDHFVWTAIQLQSLCIKPRPPNNLIDRQLRETKTEMRLSDLEECSVQSIRTRRTRTDV